MAESSDDLRRLREKLEKALELSKRARAEKDALEKEIDRLRGELKDRPKRFDVLERDLQALRHEREDVRRRVEKLIQQIESLTNSSSEG